MVFSFNDKKQTNKISGIYMEVNISKTFWLYARKYFLTNAHNRLKLNYINITRLYAE